MDLRIADRLAAAGLQQDGDRAGDGFDGIVGPLGLARMTGDGWRRSGCTSKLRMPSFESQKKLAPLKR
jgi:hypothetical protein